MPDLSVIIPVYNEKGTVVEIVNRVAAVPISKEIILVDDGSHDGTRELIREHFKNRPDVRVILHDKNRGKGGAIRTGIREASGEWAVIQDADLEYDPADYLKLFQAAVRENVRVVYGSRFLSGARVTSFWHRFVNGFLTGLTNALFGSRLTDMETCYKFFRVPFLKNLALERDGFEMEVELTARTLQKKERIAEVPISYQGRSFHEGKKIGWKDGFKAVYFLFWYRFFYK